MRSASPTPLVDGPPRRGLLRQPEGQPHLLRRGRLRRQLRHRRDQRVLLGRLLQLLRGHGRLRLVHLLRVTSDRSDCCLDSDSRVLHSFRNHGFCTATISRASTPSAGASPTPPSPVERAKGAVVCGKVGDLRDHPLVTGTNTGPATSATRGRHGPHGPRSRP